jgi:hypothetical protein
MSAFTHETLRGLMKSTDIPELTTALKTLDSDIEALQIKMDDLKFELDDTYKTSGLSYRDHYKTTFEINFGNPDEGVPEYGLSPKVGLKRLRMMRDRIKEYLKEKSNEAHPGAPTAEEAEREQDAIEESIDSIVGPELAELIEDDKRQTEHEESHDEKIHELVHEDATMRMNLRRIKLIDSINSQMRELMLLSYGVF